MSIIQPNRKQNIILLIVGLSVLFIMFTVGNIMIYSKTVSLTHDLNSLKANLSNLQVNNAELKNALYTETDSNAMSKIIATRGLIEDKNPQWVIVSAQ